MESLLELEGLQQIQSFTPALLDSPFASWCVARISTAAAPNFPPLFLQNRLLATEILATILTKQLSASAISNTHISFDLSQVPAHPSLLTSEFYSADTNTLNGVESILVSLAPFRNTNPDSIEAVEYMENLFDILTAAIM